MRYDYSTGTLSGFGLVVASYGYTDSDWGDLLTSYNGQTIAYDSMGNPTSYAGKTLTWEGKQLIAASIPRPGVNKPVAVSYAYDENGLRLEKTVAGTKTEYYYNGSVLIGMKIGTGSSAKLLRFSYDASGNVVAVDYSTDNGSTFTTYYYLRNAQNDIVKIVDSSGTTVVQYIYDSWGKLLSVTGTLATSLGTDQPFRYRGYVYDEETEWYYLQSRYYDPATCRFISADVLLSTGQGVIGHNAFAYCLNNPVCSIDTDGERTIYIPWGDLPYKGFIHYAVQLYIIYVACPEMHLSMEVRVTMPDGRIGRIDLYQQSTGCMWEVKPANLPLVGVEQLTDYSSGVVDCNPLIENMIGGPIPSGSFHIGSIKVSYWYAGSGVILYKFGLEEVPVPVPEKTPKYYPKKWEKAVSIKPSTVVTVGAVFVAAAAACYALAHSGGWLNNYSYRIA